MNSGSDEMKTKQILGISGIAFVVILLSIGIALAVYDLPGRVLPPTLPDSSPIFSELDESEYYITDVLNSLPDAELNTLYYKIFVPNDNDNQWNQSVEFAESKPYFLLKPKTISGITYISPFTGRGLQYAWVCCNVTQGDRLYTANATNDSLLRGTLTNTFNLNYKSRYPYDNGTFRNTFVGASQNPPVYNRRAAALDGTQIAYAMETKNVTVSGVPELMKVFLI